MKRSILVLCLIFSTACLTKTKVAVLSDLNGTECQPYYPSVSLNAVSSVVQNFDFQLSLFSGDVVHGECGKKMEKNHYKQVTNSMWAEFDKQFFNPLRKNGPVSVAPGNHDAPFLPWYGGNYRPNVILEDEAFNRYWLKKEKDLGVKRIKISGVKDGYPYHWAYTHGGNLYIILESTSYPSLTNAKEQKEWLRTLLNAKERKNAQKTIVSFHIPPYPVLSTKESKYKAYLKNEQVGKSGSLMDLLIDKNVDLLIVGHSHAPFPGKLTRKKDGKTIKILSMPCTHSPRRLSGDSSASKKGFAMLEVSDKIKMGIYTFDNNSHPSLVPSNYFPRSIQMNNSLIKYERIDSTGYGEIDND